MTLTETTRQIRVSRGGKIGILPPTGMILVGILYLALTGAAAPPAAVPPDHAAKMAQGLELFKNQVRALLVDQCLKCHGGEKTKGALDLSSREDLLHGGAEGPAIVPGNAKLSRLYKLITHAEKPHMPHKAPKLSEQALAHIAAWIDAGAPYDKPLIEKGRTGLATRPITDKDRQFWSFQPLQRTALPVVKNEGWCRAPVDRFILAKLEARGLRPNPIVDRRKLIRRAYFDLIGLPPTPEEVEAFVHDKASDAYEQLLDRLLASPHYGERWGRHWLDLARFAESHGYEQDYDRPSAYHFRDFVIQALNQDMPYHRFVQWQIAGDELEPNNPQALMATGYLAAGTHATQITANQVEKERYDELDDMAATIGTSMLGMTIGCARCHDHKFDPIPQQDYYRLISTFTTTVRSEIDLDLHPDKYQLAKAEFDRQHAPLAEALARFEKDQLPGRLEQWLKSGARAPQPRWLVLEAVSLKSQGGATFTKQADGSYLAGGANAAFDTYTFVAHTPLKGITAVKLEALAHPALVKGGPGRAGNGNFALSDFRVTAGPLDDKSPPVPLKLINPKATFEQKGLPIAAAIDDDGRSAWAVDPQFGKDHAAVFEVEKPRDFEGGTVLTFALKFQNNNGHNIGRPRLAVSTVPRPATLDGDQGPHQLAIDINAILQTPAEQRTAQQKTALLQWYRTIDPDWKKLNQAVQDHLKKAPLPNLTKVLIASEGLPAIRLHTQGADFFDKTYFLKRGDLKQKVGEATQSFPQVLTRAPAREKHWQSAPPKGWRTSYRRTALARWITDTDNGAGNLLARVLVNRLWQHHLGRGIVATPSDFGAQGERPTHPELLDFLAGTLIQEGWKLKPLHKLIMSSAAYQESTVYDAAQGGADPDNRLFWRRERRRLEGEAIRDAMLAISGTLDPTMFGPGSLDEGQRRRSIYFTIKRSQLIPLMMLFDAPDSLQSLGNRASTTIPPQAMALLNNPHVRGYAHAFARRILPKTEGALGEAVRAGYQIALGRAPSEEELADTVAFLQGQVESYKSAGKTNGPELALADFCQALMSLNEFVFLE